MEGEEESNKGSQGIANSFGILPYILKVCEATNHTFADVMKQTVVQTFYIATYLVKIELMKQEEIRKQQLKAKANRRH